MSSSAAGWGHDAIEHDRLADGLAAAQNARAYVTQSMPMGALRRKVADVDQETERDAPVCKNLSGEATRGMGLQGDAAIAVRCEDATLTDTQYRDSKRT